MKGDLSRYVDLQFLAVTTLVRNKDKLVKLFRSLSDRRHGVRPAQRHLLRPRHRRCADDRVGVVQEPVDHARIRLRGRLHQRLHRAEHAVPPAAADEVPRLHPLPGPAARAARQDHPRLRQDPCRRPLLARDHVGRHPQRPWLRQTVRARRKGSQRRDRRRKLAAQARSWCSPSAPSAIARSRTGW